MTTTSLAEPTRVLRVGADPDNLPFSNRRGEGFENRLAELVARELNARLEYVWIARAAQRGGEVLATGGADVLIGVPAGLAGLLTTRPYYASSYMFVYRREAFPVRSFDDPVLCIMRIGVPLAGGNSSDTLPVHALALRGHLENIRGYAAFDRAAENPTAEIIRAVARREIDLAVAWGPLAGYFAMREGAALEMAPVSTEEDAPELPFVFAISMAVRPGNRALRAELDATLVRCRMEIARILDDFNVPRVSPQEPAAALGRARPL